MTIPKMTPFRSWVHNLWIENCEERDIYQDGPRLDEREYWHRFRWWLRREWRHRCRQEQEREQRQKALTRALKPPK